MRQDQGSGDRISASIGGSVSGGHVAVGKGIVQTAVTGGGALTPAERAELDGLIADLRARVAAEAPPDQREAALERVGEIEQELAAEKPDVTTLAYVRNWFVKKLPGLAGAVVSLVVHPLVGKLVGAVGEGLAGQLRGRIDGG